LENVNGGWVGRARSSAAIRVHYVDLGTISPVEVDETHRIGAERRPHQRRDREVDEMHPSALPSMPPLMFARP
jgi:hypothetical protein